MAFSVGKGNPFRTLGLFRKSGKHAAPRGTVHAVPKQSASGAHRPAHAATMPRLTGPNAVDKHGKKAALRSGNDDVRTLRRT